MNKPMPAGSDPDLWKKAIDAMRLVIDPELGINIVDMGLLYSVYVGKVRKEILVEMTLSTRGCPMGAAIEGGVVNILRSRFPEYSISVNLVWEPAWSYEFISEEGRQQLEE